jgi:hypothetical protein
VTTSLPGFTQDYPFKTKSGAASVILGASSNGNEVFKKEEKKGN